MHRNGKAHYLGYIAAQIVEESAKLEERWLFFRLCVCGPAVSRAKILVVRSIGRELALLPVSCTDRL